MNSETLLYRVVHAAFVQEGTITSQVFRPSTTDGELVSVLNGDQITPQDALERLAHNYPIAGVVAVSVAECLNLQLPVWQRDGFSPDHSVIDFAGLSGNQVRRRAHLLKEFANARGWLVRA